MEENESQRINQEGKEYDSSDAITSKPQTQQDINKDAVDLPTVDDSSHQNQTFSRNKSKADKKIVEEDFHTDDQLLSVVKKRQYYISRYVFLSKM